VHGHLPVRCVLPAFRTHAASLSLRMGGITRAPGARPLEPCHQEEL